MEKGAPAERTFGKRVLVEISHAIERFALAAEPDEPLLVIAMFQRLSYFEREADVYGTLAGRGAVTVVGLVENYPPQLPEGVRHAVLSPSDDLAREWSVTVVGPHGGATLVAVDSETVDPAAYTLEQGRRFHGRWSFRHEEAIAEARRLRDELPLSGDTRRDIDAVLQAAQAAPAPATATSWDAPLQFLVDRLHTTLSARASVQAKLDEPTERNPLTGLFTPTFLQRWMSGFGQMLPIGLLALRVPGLSRVRGRYGLRAELAAIAGVARSVHDLITPADRLVQLSPEDFLVVLPSWSPQHVHMLRAEVCARVAHLDEQFPFVPLTATGAVTVTREQPLPVDELTAQLDGDPRSAPVLTG